MKLICASTPGCKGHPVLDSGQTRLGSDILTSSGGQRESLEIS